MICKTKDGLVALVAGAAILLAAESGVQARSAGAGSSPHPQTTNTTSRATAPVHTTSPKRGRYGWGYGRGWCYWHPYACYRNTGNR